MDKSGSLQRMLFMNTGKQAAGSGTISGALKGLKGMREDFLSDEEIVLEEIKEQKHYGVESKRPGSPDFNRPSYPPANIKESSDDASSYDLTVSQTIGDNLTQTPLSHRGLTTSAIAEAVNKAISKASSNRTFADSVNHQYNQPSSSSNNNTHRQREE